MKGYFEGVLNYFSLIFEAAVSVGLLLTLNYNNFSFKNLCHMPLLIIHKIMHLVNCIFI